MLSTKPFGKPGFFFVWTKTRQGTSFCFVSRHSTSFHSLSKAWSFFTRQDFFPRRLVTESTEWRVCTASEGRCVCACIRRKCAPIRTLDMKRLRSVFYLPMDLEKAANFMQRPFQVLAAPMNTSSIFVFFFLYDYFVLLNCGFKAGPFDTKYASLSLMDGNCFNLC